MYRLIGLKGTEITQKTTLKTLEPLTCKENRFNGAINLHHVLSFFSFHISVYLDFEYNDTFILRIKSYSTTFIKFDEELTSGQTYAGPCNHHIQADRTPRQLGRGGF